MTSGNLIYSYKTTNLLNAEFELAKNQLSSIYKNNESEENKICLKGFKIKNGIVHFKNHNYETGYHVNLPSKKNLHLIDENKKELLVYDFSTLAILKIDNNSFIFTDFKTHKKI